VLAHLAWQDEVDLGVALGGCGIGWSLYNLTSFEDTGVIVMAVSLAMLVVPLVKLLWLSALRARRHGDAASGRLTIDQVRSRDRQNLIVAVGGISIGAVLGLTVDWESFGMTFVVLGCAFAVGPAVRLGWMRCHPGFSRRSGD
jgi:hypothetical protein